MGLYSSFCQIRHSCLRLPKIAGVFGRVCVVVALVCAAICVSSHSAEAQDEESVTMPLPVEASPHSSADNYLSMEMQQYDYNPQGAQSKDQFSQYTQAIAAFGFYHEHLSDAGIKTSFETDGLAVLPMSEGTHFEIGLPNAYWSLLTPSKHFQLSVGRELQSWSELDDYWHLGIWQPLARWDAADPITQGLTGLFAHFNEDNYRVVLFASDIFLPDQEPDYQASNGQITSDNRWFRAPVSQITTGNAESTFNYSIASVNISKIVFQPTFALMTEFGREDEGPFFRASAAQKPMNQFHLVETPTEDVGTDTVNVPIIPMVIQEHVLTAEAGYRLGDNSEVVLSNTWERFDNPNLPANSNYLQSQLIDSDYMGMIYRQNLEQVGLPHSDLSVSYVNRVKQTNPQADTIVNGNIESSADRLAFDKLLGVQFHHALWQGAKSGLDGEVAYNYSINDQGVWIQSMVNYKYDPHWTWSLAGDLFGLPASSENSTSFISIYRGNDRLIGGLTYVY